MQISRSWLRRHLLLWPCLGGLALAQASPLPGAGTPAPPTAAPRQSGAAPQLRDTGKPSATTNVNSADVKTGHAVAARASLPQVVPAGRPVVGVALEGGGALGLAHIGFFQWTEEHHVPVDRIAGTSMGALIGGLFATGHSPESMHRVAASGVFRTVFALETPYADSSFRRREDGRELPQGIKLGLKGGPSLRNSLLDDAGMNVFLRDNFDHANSSELNYDTLPVPFRCVSTDLNTMRQVVFEGGPMPQAIRASIAIPGLLAPVQYHDHYLVDGGMLDNLPTDIVKTDLHADIVIAVHLNASTFSVADVSSIVGVFERAFSAGVARNERDGEKLADVLVTIDTSKFTTMQYDKADELVKTGYEAAEQQREKLLRYALNDEDWAAYVADRQGRVPPLPGELREVKVEGGSAGAKASVQAALQPLRQEPIQPAPMAKALSRVQGNGDYRATYETYSPDSKIAGPQAQGPDTGVLVRLSKARNGPPFLLVGADIDAANSNVTRTTLDARVIDQDLGGYGSELRSDIRVGFLTLASTEYYRQLTGSGYYVQPHVGLLREPVYLWQDQHRISERLEQQAGGGLDVGRTFNRNLQTAFEYRAQTVRWHLVNGDDGTPTYSGTAQTAVAHVLYDSTEASQLSPQGMRVEASAGGLFHTLGSDTAPLLKLDMSRGFSLGEHFVAGLTFDANSYLKRSVAEPLRFSLGGPLHLSASSIDEYRGTDDALLRAGVLRRVATLPSGIGQGLYAGITYEAGEIWAPERSTILRQDGALTAIGVTPLGVITVGGAVGDAGRRKIFFSFGRLF